MKYIGVFRTDPDHRLPVSKLKTKHYYLVYGQDGFYVGLCRFTEDYNMTPVYANTLGTIDGSICFRYISGDNGMSDILSDYDELFELSDEDVNNHIVMEVI